MIVNFQVDEVRCYKIPDLHYKSLEYTEILYLIKNNNNNHNTSFTLMIVYNGKMWIIASQVFYLIGYKI